MPSVESRPWPRRRFWTTVALVFAAQIGIILWLSDRTPAQRRNPLPAPFFSIAGPEIGESLALDDPTLFSLPHPKSFSGAAWLIIPQREFQRKSWSEPLRWLPPPVNELGVNFQSFIETNPPPRFQPRLALEPKLTMPPRTPLTPVSPPSTFTITGPLAQRQMLGRFELKPWRSADLITNNVVQVWVDARGHVSTAVLLLPRSGSDEADREALRLANEARFNPIERVGPDRPPNASAVFTEGTFTFFWQTLPPTNGAAAAR